VVNTHYNSSESEEGELLVHAGNVAEVLRRKTSRVPLQLMLAIIYLAGGTRQHGLTCYHPGEFTRASNQGV